MVAVTDAPPTVDTLDWEEAVTLGSEAWQHSEQSKWDIGDIGAIVAHKWKRGSIKNFANSIGMHDRPGRLRDYVKVARFWSKDIREQYPNTSWSVFRELSRHKLTAERALELLTKHHDKPVAKVREAILGKRAPRPVVVEFRPVYDGDGDLHLWNDDSRKLDKLMTEYPDAAITVTVTYAPAPNGQAEA